MFSYEKSSLLEPLKPGKYTISTNEVNKPAARPEMSPEEKREIQRRFNKASFLRETFATPNDTTIEIIELPSGGKVVIMAPSGPYTELSVMVVAIGTDSLNYGDDEKIPTQMIYDYPEDVQKAYFQAIRTVQQFYMKEHPNARVFSTENAIGICTGDSVTPDGPAYVTSRTIVLPHTQICILEDEHIETKELLFKPELRKNIHKERRILQNELLATQFLGKLQAEFTAITGDELANLHLRTFAPYGYSFFADETKLQQVMAAHHQAYTKVAQEYYERLSPRNKARIVPQPSYRLFSSPHGEQQQFVISTQILPFGPIEAADIELDRKAENPRQTPLEKVHHYHNLLRASYTAQKVLV